MPCPPGYFPVPDPKFDYRCVRVAAMGHRMIPVITSTAASGVSGQGIGVIAHCGGRCAPSHQEKIPVITSTQPTSRGVGATQTTTVTQPANSSSSPWILGGLAAALIGGVIYATRG